MSPSWDGTDDKESSRFTAPSFWLLLEQSFVQPTKAALLRAGLMLDLGRKKEHQEKATIDLSGAGIVAGERKGIEDLIKQQIIDPSGINIYILKVPEDLQPYFVYLGEDGRKYDRSIVVRFKATNQETFAHNSTRSIETQIEGVHSINLVIITSSMYWPCLKCFFGILPV